MPNPLTPVRKPVNGSAIAKTDRHIVCYRKAATDYWKAIEGHFNKSEANRARYVLERHEQDNGRETQLTVFNRHDIYIVGLD